MIFAWFAGDFFKGTYYLIYNAPIQLIFTTGFQLLIDTLIVVQFYLYRVPKPRIDEVRNLQVVDGKPSPAESKDYGSAK